MANSPARSAIDVGAVIADTYKIEAMIGRGGMGAVFLATHNRLPGKKVAIKLLHAELHDEDVMVRFRREAEITARLGHPNIVQVHDFNIMPNGTPYLVLEYLEGQTLAQKISRSAHEGPIPLDQIMSIVRQVGSALAAAHREGIVHRDLKPQNIFLIPTEVDGRLVEIAKVLDFGISKIVGSQTVKTQESTLLGTPQYMAPEQANGQHASVDQRTDVFALGAIVYEMLNGHPAFSGASIPEVVFKVVYEQPAPMLASVPISIADAVKQAMAKPAGERFPTIGGFVEALTGVPLASFRPSAAQLPHDGLAVGSKQVSNQEAFANTMGSGDYTPPPMAIVVPGPSVGGSSPTVDSQAGTPAPVVGLAGAPTSLAGTPAPLPTKRPVALLFALAGAVTAGVVMFLVMRQPHRRTKAEAARVAVITPQAHLDSQGSEGGRGTERAGSAAPERVDAPDAPDPMSGSASKVVPAANPHATEKPTTTKPTKATKPTQTAKPASDKSAKVASASPPDSSPDTFETGTDDEARAKQSLADAELELAHKNYEAASLAANAVIRSNAALKPRMIAQARVVVGIVECAKNHSALDAKIYLRKIARFSALAQRLKKSCSFEGQPLD